MAGLQGRFAAKANPMQEMMAKKKAEEAERNAKLQKKAKMAARIAALGIQDDKLTATEKEAKRRASISLQCQAMSFEKNDIDPKMKRMMRSEFSLVHLRPKPRLVTSNSATRRRHRWQRLRCFWWRPRSWPRPWQRRST